MFGGFRDYLPMTARADQDVVLLPMHADLTEEQVSYIVRKVKDSAR